ncbi:GMC family oxidoreductase N-terminal domain-containing protein [Gordonia polyisoprenivorans]|uniref:GMC family oxidoreductase N-terminal domain-containing protein n=1 Tax=Gordonia polyisoprenivorans TaxID=84595 RepID=UPI002300F4BD|nr:GMC family oxidoreductase [Gordonia polyisoprenivorans]WCB35350.1 GMC family oxidoreductase [Gordonia polyisoprenivorans]
MRRERKGLAHRNSEHFDVLVIGSGFGGSVSALRLVEKGYHVGVLEAGARFDDADFAGSTWNLKKFLWAPRLGLYGVQRIHLLDDVMVVAGAGVGGGSLNYANTLYKPPARFFDDPQWRDITDWDGELSPFYDQARRMLGVVTNPHETPADEVIRQVAEEMGVADTFTATPVGVYFNEPGRTDPDPYFGGAGPDRTGCTECGQCMTGCRVGAKNTLMKNYIYLAEKGGARFIPMTTVTDVRQGRRGAWEVLATNTRDRRTGTMYTADNVVFAAGTWGTQTLLHHLKDSGTLPKLSDRLGMLTRTNSESVLGAARYSIDPDHDLSRGVAITSSFYPTPDTHIEPVRYGPGRNAMGLLQTLLVDGGTGRTRIPGLLKGLAERPHELKLLLTQKDWGQRVMVLLVMQSLDNSITTYTKKIPGSRRRRLASKQGHGSPNPTWIPIGNEVARRVAATLGGIAGGAWSDIFNVPVTAHFLGGATISDTPETGVIDAYHRIHGYPSLFVVDGSAISANLGVNPSLSIAAQAERAASLWPNKGEPDARPVQGVGYQRIAPIAPRSPAVAAGAPAQLLLPVPRVRTTRDIRERADHA